MIKKLIYFTFFVFGIGVFFGGCTRDDLCPAETATTPNMIITFHDYRNENRRKAVEGISIETWETEPDIVLRRTSSDSVSVPLNVNSHETGYRFIKTTITETDTIVDVEEIRFSYLKKDIYVNRACGFRAEFGNLEIEEHRTTGNPWVREIKIKTDSIVDETKAHITILH